MEVGGRGRCVCYACCRELLWPEPRLGAGPLYKYALIMSSAKSAANLRAKGGLKKEGCREAQAIEDNR